jgi:hypothetical protein
VRAGRPWARSPAPQENKIEFEKTLNSFEKGGAAKSSQGRCKMEAGRAKAAQIRKCVRLKQTGL